MEMNSTNESLEQDNSNSSSEEDEEEVIVHEEIVNPLRVTLVHGDVQVIPAALKHEEIQLEGGLCPVEGLSKDWRTNGENKNLINRILGCIYGNALGDAYGLATEFESKREVERNYKGEVIPFPNFKQTFHSSCWTKGDWTDDTDQMILIMEVLTETGKADEKLFARKLKHWVRHGFSELGDFSGMGCGGTVASAVYSADFEEDPHKVAQRVWKDMNYNGAANGGVMRTSILGCYQYNDLPAVIANTTSICTTTHADTRCIASCVATTVAIAMMLQEKYDVTDLKGVDSLIDEVIKISLPLVAEEHKETFLLHIKPKSVEALDLDESRAIGYTLKCMGGYSIYLIFSLNHS